MMSDYITKDQLAELAAETRLLLEQINTNAGFLTQAGFTVEIKTVPFTLSSLSGAMRGTMEAASTTTRFNQFEVEISKKVSL